MASLCHPWFTTNNLSKKGFLFWNFRHRRRCGTTGISSQYEEWGTQLSDTHSAGSPRHPNPKSIHKKRYGKQQLFRRKLSDIGFSMNLVSFSVYPVDSKSGCTHQTWSNVAIRNAYIVGPCGKPKPQNPWVVHLLFLIYGSFLKWGGYPRIIHILVGLQIINHPFWSKNPMTMEPAVVF